ncbi:MAG: hypothetical protein M3373_14345 [Gemmatimonadota bacterium]|nr:hypothetical protein [Gemmatimonadota bacterium]
MSHVTVAVGCLAVILAYAVGRSGAGHQVKSAVILLAALCLYVLEVQALRSARPIRSAFGTDPFGAR